MLFNFYNFYLFDGVDKIIVYYAASYINETSILLTSTKLHSRNLIITPTISQQPKRYNPEKNFLRDH
jgi:hypothetical protein